MLAALRYESVDGQFRQEMEPHRGEKRKANPDLGNKNLGIGWIRSKLPQEHCFICVIRSKRSGLALQAACWKLLAEIISLKLVPVSDTGRYMLAFAVQAVTTGLIGLQTGIFLCQDHMVSYEEIREDVADIIRNISMEDQRIKIHPVDSSEPVSFDNTWLPAEGRLPADKMQSFGSGSTSWVHIYALKDVLRNIVRYPARCFQPIPSHRRDYAMVVGTSTTHFRITRSGLSNLRIDIGNISEASHARGFKKLMTRAQDPRQVQDSAARLFNQFRKEFMIDRLSESIHGLLLNEVIQSPADNKDTESELKKILDMVNATLPDLRDMISRPKTVAKRRSNRGSPPPTDMDVAEINRIVRWMKDVNEKLYSLERSMMRGHEENRETQSYLGSQLAQLGRLLQPRDHQHPNVVELAVNQIIDDAAPEQPGQHMEQDAPVQPKQEVHHVQEPLPADFLQRDCEPIQF